jgi:ABC-2 type transport system permease protein
MFLSSLTESQVIAAVSGFGVSLFLVLVDSLSYVVTNSFLQTVFRALSFNDRYVPFTIGVLEFSNTIFFLSISALFLLFTVAVLDRRRWN